MRQEQKGEKKMKIQKTFNLEQAKTIIAALNCNLVQNKIAFDQTNHFRNMDSILCEWSFYDNLTKEQEEIINNTFAE